MFWKTSRTILHLFMLTLGVTLLGVTLLPDRAWMEQSGRHCGGVGPLDPTFCGCAWGAVYYRGQPLAQAPVQLTFNGATVAATFNGASAAESYPFYAVSGSELGARRGDTMTMTVSIGHVSTTRAFRAEPVNSGDDQGEQEIALVLPEQGQWQPWLTGGYTRTLLVDGPTLWAGGPAGLLRINSGTGLTATQTLPWSAPGVSALAKAPGGRLWVAGPQALAYLDGTQWQNVPPPFSAPIRAIAVEPTTGALWVGGGSNSGALARYNGSWQSITAVLQPIMTLTIDSVGELWAGTWGGGVYRRSGTGADLNSGWQQIRVSNGLAADYILSATAAGADLWFGTRPYLGSQGVLGGISHYQRATGQWQNYSRVDGLPAAPDLPGAPVRIYALTVDSEGSIWAGSEVGVHLLAAPGLWLTDLATSAPVYALAAEAETRIATTGAGQLQRLDRTITPGAPPTAAFSAENAATFAPTALIELQATALDHDEAATPANTQILAWDWVSDRDGPLCTTANSCTIPATNLRPGRHQITLRVQDDEGVWSAGTTTTLTIDDGAATPTATPTATPAVPATPTLTPLPTRSVTSSEIYLPLINRSHSDPTLTRP